MQFPAAMLVLCIGVACAGIGCQRDVKPPTVTVKPAARSSQHKPSSQAGPAASGGKEQPAAAEPADQP